MIYKTHHEIGKAWMNGTDEEWWLQRLNRLYYEYLMEAPYVDRLENIRYAERKLVSYQMNDGEPC